MPDLTARISEVIAATRKAPCLQCKAEPLEPCWPPPGTCLIRFTEARREGLIPAADYARVLASVVHALAPDAVDAATGRAA
jgi:hypothetical protein